MAAYDCFKGLVAGTMIGFILGILFAPKSGKVLREDICKTPEDLLEEARERYEQAKIKIEEMVGRQKDTLAEKGERLRRAIEAGEKAFREEVTSAPRTEI